mmetsp:Transcript_17300/g.37329  ORF Transcript_17300/g.37329 Transcript_17300/m.37329 type:complete len:320 (+) Transcript_17300:1470-2429(+)
MVILLWIEFARRQAEGEVGRLQMRPTIFRHSLDPAHGSLQEGDGGHVVAAAAAIYDADEGADQTHVVVLGQPRHNCCVRGGVQFIRYDVQIVGQVGMRQGHSFRSGGRSRSVLDEGGLVRFRGQLRLWKDLGRVVQRLLVRHDPNQFFRPRRHVATVFSLCFPLFEFRHEGIFHLTQSFGMSVFSVGQRDARSASACNAHERGYAVLPSRVGRVDRHGNEAGAEARQECHDEVRRAGRVDKHHAVSFRQGWHVLRDCDERFALGVELEPLGREETRREVFHRKVQFLIRDGRRRRWRVVPVRLQEGESVFVRRDVCVVP